MIDLDHPPRKRVLFWLLLAVTAIFAGGLSPPSQASMGVLEPFIDMGPSDGWYGSQESDQYWLRNDNQSGAIRYYHGSTDGSYDGKRKISVDIALQAGEAQARAGLIYGRDLSGNYYLIVLGPEGQLEIVRRDRSGFHLRSSFSTGANPGAFNHLEVSENGNEISISLNGRNYGGFGNDTVGTGAVGVVASGIGRFGFKNYQTNENQQARIQQPKTVPTPKPIRRASTNSTSQNSGGFEKQTIRDEFGFSRPMDAASVETPTDWRFNGAVQWIGRAECELERMKVHFKTTAPDGKQWVELLPGGVWAWNSNLDANPVMARQGVAGCDARPIRSVDAFLRQYLTAIRPGANIERIRMRPDLAQELMQGQNMRQGLQPGQQPRFEVAQADISYDAQGGRTYETLIPSILFIDQAAMDQYGSMNGYLTIAQALGTITAGAVGQKPDQDLMMRISGTMTFLPDYMQQLTAHMKQRIAVMQQAHQRKVAAQQAWLAQRRANLAASESAFANRPGASSATGSGSDVLDIQFETYKNTSGMRNAGQARSVDAIHERTPWQNANGSTIYMPQEYQRVYQLPNDVYVGTNDAFFNPVESFGQFGDSLNQQQY